MAKVLHAFRSLRTRNYRLFWFGQLVSVAGTWMQDLALGWLVLSLTQSPTALGLMVTIRFLPATFFSLYGGVLADRLRKRRAIIYCNVAQFAVAVVLGVLTSTELITVGIIYGLAALRGLIETIEVPSRQSFVAEMVGTENLSNAIALNSTQFNAARLVGPAIGGILIQTVGIAACFYLNAASFLAVIVALMAMRVAELHLIPRLPRAPVLGQLREGLGYARSNPHVVLIMIIMAALGTFGYNFGVLLPLVAKYVLHGDSGTLALLMATMGAGAVTAGLFAAYRGKPSQRLLLVSAALFVVVFAGVGVSPWTALTVALVFVMGALQILFLTTANTRLQLAVPGHMRGRMIGIHSLLFVGTTPIGAYLMGQTAEAIGQETIGVQVMVLMMAALCAIGVGIGIAYVRRTGTQDFLAGGAVPADGVRSPSPAEGVEGAALLNGVVGAALADGVGRGES
jgi:MFS family permease